MQVGHIMMLAAVASVIGGLGFFVHSQLGSAAGQDANDALEHSLANISGRYSFAPELCDDPDLIVEITNDAVDFSEVSASADIKFETIDSRVVALPLTGKTSAHIGVWKTPNGEIRTSLFSRISQSDLKRLELRPSPSTDRDVLGYTVYDFDALDKFDTFSTWAPAFIEGYALYPCDHTEPSSADLKLPS